MAIAAGIHTTDTNLVVPLLFLKTLPTWFAGFAFGAIAIGALVPAAIMAIAAANLFTRNVYREYFASPQGPNREAKVAKIVGMIVILGALFFIVVIPLQYAIYFQTLGGIWILQTVPAIMFGLYTRWFHRWALLTGWLVGMAIGTGMAAAESFKTSLFPLHVGHSVILAYAGIWAIVANIVVTVVLTLIFNAVHLSNGEDKTATTDYTEDHEKSVAAQ
jgi:SSS family solute:Na+ symporter